MLMDAFGAERWAECCAHLHATVLPTQRLGLADVRTPSVRSLIGVSILDWRVQIACLHLSHVHYRLRLPKLTHRFSKRVLDLAQNILLWPYAVFMSDPHDIRTKNGMDAYFFVRFLRMMVFYLVPVWLVSWTVLLPITAIGSGQSGLNQFNFGSVSTADTLRYPAHLILAWVFTSASTFACLYALF